MIISAFLFIGLMLHWCCILCLSLSTYVSGFISICCTFKHWLFVWMLMLFSFQYRINVVWLWYWCCVLYACYYKCVFWFVTECQCDCWSLWCDSNTQTIPSITHTSLRKWVMMHKKKSLILTVYAFSASFVRGELSIASAKFEGGKNATFKITTVQCGIL